MKAESLLEALGCRIAAGELTDELPSENALAQRYDVSRTTVRAALQGLVARGLVEIRPASGARVCDHEQWDWLDEAVLRWVCDSGNRHMIHQAGFDARLLVEPSIAGLAARHASAADLAEMDQALKIMDSHHQDAPAFHLADTAFHGAMARASHNPILCRLSRALESVQRTLFEHSYRQDESEIRLTVSLHRQLLESIRLRQPDQAEALARELIETCHRRLDEPLAADDTN
ncbi:FadR/GntR family transcriptional regulator [Salinisphaera sp. Q1T1-3]|uniref:FadR/GntR family transcriptional regulator n=1 Tax=Salinisphaera sp. Q1T1-3 TaxID=2321229 RepID=UPI000E733BEE|nr:FadR/GntR family transcriptional regulator [Salinisphaera sp. Q1T1-3]RJS93042.1 FadR family transcriptional regulator [Salinisphaera sp. Q1T1-3]